ncbi:DNA cytosine methyltransferase [Achromobacter sp. PAB15]|uniref:DNA cytosine methyltransferase n=1 Tax=Achromobacter sp. PAB15 TaxID=3233048 RepID=UPI003F90D8D5
MIQADINHFHLFAGAGSGAAGMQDAAPAIPGLQGRMVCVGGMDVDPAGAEDFYRFTGVRCTVRDLFSRDQYVAFHGHEPPADWVEALPEDVRAAAGGRRPNIVFLSAPCKGFSGLLSQSLSLTAKYQSLNALTLRGVWLMLEAWKDDPVEVILFENVPRIATRGRHFLDQIVQLLRHYGYVVRETAHDCGEIGGLAQSRKRFLLIARHADKVPAFIYEPPKRPLRAVGEILGRMHLPGDLRAGPMHRIPNLSWKTWVRLAFVEAGSDCEFRIVPFNETARAVTSAHGTGQCVADPRTGWPEGAHGNKLAVTAFEEAAKTVTGARFGSGGLCVADPRGGGGHSKYAVTEWDGASRTVISGSTTGQGAFAVADPRPGLARERGDHYLTAGHYGVAAWDRNIGAVSASACHDNGAWSVADPRLLPAADDKLACRILSLDGTWHRPFTTLELAALQSLYDPDDYAEAEERGEVFRMDGTADSAHRERIGNAVPRKAAKAMGEVIGQAILLSRAGESFQLSASPIWVRPIATALAVAGGL